MELLVTSRLSLVPATADQIRAVIRGDYTLASALLGSTVPVGWPDESEAREGLSWHLSAMEKDPGQRLWRIRFIIATESNRLIGSVNLKGLPSTDGDVEIGWGIVADVRGRGFATEASRAVMDWALSSGQVSRISATVPEDNPASQRVAQRLGMVRTGETRRGLPVWATC